MDKTWGRVGELFHAACALAVDERERWVRSACADEPMSSEVLALLKAYEEDPAFLERPVPADAAGALHAVTSQSVEGRRVGPYHLVREIGRGGMGIVYEALQTDGDFSRRVAIKLVPSGWTASSLTERFRYERRVLARLDHPGIARLLDAGTTDEGTPYFVMDLVDGEPIDLWCREHTLTVRQRIELAVRVCEAVEHAHRNLVVHRDLKASNILVAADGQPKLLDFGIAKFLSEEAESDGQTETRQQVFTPGCASPEQIRGEGATTATDVYSLGVLLYLLLAEQPPFDVAALSPFEAMRTVCEADPPMPSTVARLAWRRTLQGDIDNVLLRALQKDPHERYPSVHAMADDLRAWLDGRPVWASPGTLWYRTRKLVVRRKAAAVAIAAVSLALTAGAVTTAWQTHVARLERDKSQSRLREVRVFSRSLLFELHDAIKGLPGSTPSRQLLLSRATQFLDGLAKDADDDRALKVELAEGYRRLGHVQGSDFSENIGDVASAIASFEKAARFGEDVLALAPGSSDGAIVLAGAYADLAAARLARGDIDAADQAYRRQLVVLEQLERTKGTEPTVLAALAASYSDLGYFRGLRKDYPGAKALYAKAISLHDALPAPQRESEEAMRSHAFALKRLGALLVFEGSLDDGESRYRAALALDERMIARHPEDARYRYDITFSLNDLALIADKRGDSLGAESMWNRALAIRQAALAADPKNIRTISGIAYIHEALGNFYLSAKQVAEAIDQFREDVRLRDRLIGISGSLPGPVKELANAQVCLARALLDRAGAEHGARRAATLGEAGQWLKAAEPIARELEAQNDPELDADVKQQVDRLRRLGAP